MYSITGSSDGYHCNVQIQDGVESWTEKSLDKAVDGVINCAKVMNHTEITRHDIRFAGKNVADKSAWAATIQRRKDLIWDTRQAIENLRDAMQGTFRGVRIDDVEELHKELKSALHELGPWMPDRNTTHDVDIPSGTVSGDLLIALISFESVVDQVDIEYLNATHNHGSFHSPHEGYAVIKEELDELWDEVKTNGSKKRMKEEAIQVAAMAIRFCVDL